MTLYTDLTVLSAQVNEEGSAFWESLSQDRAHYSGKGSSQ